MAGRGEVFSRAAVSNLMPNQLAHDLSMWVFLYGQWENAN